MSKERELLKRFMTELTTEEDVVSLFNDIKECLAEPELLEEAHQEYNKPRCCICKTTENVKYVGGYHYPYLCGDPDCVPF